MSEAALPSAETLPDLYSEGLCQRGTQDNGWVKLGGGFSPLPNPPLRNIRQTVKSFNSDNIPKS